MADGDFLEYKLGAFAPVAPVAPDVQIIGDAEGKLVQTDGYHLRYEFNDKRFLYFIDDYRVRLVFVDEKRRGFVFGYNKATYKNDFDFGFYFHVDFQHIDIVVVLDQSDRDRLTRKGEKIAMFIDSLIWALLAVTKDERMKNLETDIAKAWEELLSFPAFRNDNIKVVKTAEEFSVNVTFNLYPVSVTTLKDSDMFLIKFQDHGDEKHDVFKAFLKVLNMSAKLQRLKHQDREVFTHMIGKGSNLILALYTRAKKAGVPFWEMNGYAFCTMPDFNEWSEGRINWLQSFIPDATTQKQYHKVGKSNLFGTMLISLAENIMLQEGAEAIELEALEEATSFYKQLEYAELMDGNGTMRKVFPRKFRGYFNASGFDKWGPIIENRLITKDIEAALRLVQGNTVAAAQLMHFYLKRN
jgi:hypothetical protein